MATTKTYRLYKRDVAKGKWNYVFNELEKDPGLIQGFIRGAKHQKKIQVNDLDTMLVDIGAHIKSYIEINSSGQVRFF